jgi:hypothetical protein
MDAWKQRVIDEKKELDERIARLTMILDQPSFVRMHIDLEQLDLMKRQLGYMQAYSLTLRDRIELFLPKTMEPSQ